MKNCDNKIMLEKIKKIFITASKKAEKYNSFAQNPFLKRKFDIKDTTYIWVEKPKNI